MLARFICKCPLPVKRQFGIIQHRQVIIPVGVDDLEKDALVLNHEVRVVKSEVGIVKDVDAMRGTEFFLETITSLERSEFFLAAHEIGCNEMLLALAFNGNAIVREEEVQLHRALVFQPREGLLLPIMNLMEFQQHLDIVLQVALVARRTALAEKVASRNLPELTVLFADDANRGRFVDIFNLRVVVPITVNKAELFQRLFLSEIAAGAFGTAGTSKMR